MIQSIERAINILELYHDKELLGVSEIARSLGIAKTTAHGIIKTLEHYGYLEKDEETNKYTLGISLLELGTLYMDRLDIKNKSIDYMVKLQADTGEAVQLATYKQGHIIYIARSLTNNFMRISMREGQLTPAYCTATGKVILANLHNDELDTYIKNIKFEKRTPNTISNTLDLIEELKLTRERGFSIDNEENEIGIKGIGMPIFDLKGKPIAAISLGCMAEEFHPQYIKTLVPKLQNTVQLISKKLGYQEK
ncbi:IclR family transcriptional regulator [Paratissierella segnis]|jgi:DNA-binding IclR family transcriptional regulator|uniref:Glycerol operon regulatory protein n=1 Tax=Paratissierella segnis TaxID=2763679 RepID=A0A926EUB6_9FIRM|nr:IclR family transcriptional regulator [Paratissierella segnis]MBC8587796.1 IclR family transcriptional regulator [Paratissierella segnis]